MRFARMVAHAGTYGRKGIGLTDDPVSSFEIPLRDPGDVVPGFRTQGAGGLAGRTDDVLADEGSTPPFLDVLLEFLPEITKCTQDGIRCGLSQTAHRRILDGEREFLEKVQLFQRSAP